MVVLASVVLLTFGDDGSSSTASLGYVFVPVEAIALTVLIWIGVYFAWVIRRGVREGREWRSV